MKYAILIIASLILLQNAKAQDAYKNYKMESIYLHHSSYIKNGVKYPLGLFSANLGQEMKVSPHALGEWKKYENYRTWAIVTSIVGLGLTVRSITINNNDTLRDGLLISGLGASIASFTFGLKARNQINKAVWTRNRDIL